MSKFDRWFSEYGFTLGVEPSVALKIWIAAEGATIRTISDPPYVPAVGDKVRVLSFCHHKQLGAVKEVTRVEVDYLPVYHLEYRDGGGILGEVERV